MYLEAPRPRINSQVPSHPLLTLSGYCPCCSPGRTLSVPKSLSLSQWLVIVLEQEILYPLRLLPVANKTAPNSNHPSGHEGSQLIQLEPPAGEQSWLKHPWPGTSPGPSVLLPFQFASTLNTKSASAPVMILGKSSYMNLGHTIGR